MNTAIFREMSLDDLIEKLRKKHGSLRKAAKAIDVPHQNLSNWGDSEKSLKQQEFLEALERIRKDLGIADSKMWRAMVRRSLS